MSKKNMHKHHAKWMFGHKIDKSLNIAFWRWLKPKHKDYGWTKV